MALDGETNLKEKSAAVEGHKTSSIGVEHIQQRFKGSVICDNPNEKLEQWEGILKLNDDKPVICSIKNLLVRGSIIRNTEWCIGVGIYTGPDTKIFRNSKNPPHKVSNVMRTMNMMLC
jgi:phospholipid-translocating ATPase/phospholipid-transporting ATPase